MGTIEILSPEGAYRPTTITPASGLASFDGARVGLHDNAKPGATDLLEGIAGHLAGHGATVRSWSKPHAARASHHLAAIVASCDAAVIALGD